MLRTKFVILLSTIALFPALLMAQSVDYVVDGTLTDGGIFSGSFTLDASLPDLNPTDGLGEYELAIFDLQISNTPITGAGLSPSFATSATLFQSEFSGVADLQFNLIGGPTGPFSGVFGGFQFSPLGGDADELVFLNPADFSSGNFDGAGQVDVATLRVQAVPEPSATFLLVASVSMVGLKRRRKFLG